MQIDNLYIEITNRCNLACRDCYNASGCGRETVELPPELIEQTFVSLNRQFGLKQFAISGGEPTMYSRLDELLGSLERYPDFTYLLITNGVIRHKRLYELLETDKRFAVQFSIDGTREESYSKIRGTGHYDTVIANLRSLNAVNPPVMKMVISAFNKHEIAEYFKMAQEYGCTPAFAFAEYQGRAKGNWQDMLLTEFEKLRIIEQIAKLNDEYGLKLAAPYPTKSCPLLEDKALSICVKQNGSVQPCQSLYDDAFSLGNIYALDFNEMEQNLNALREKITERNKLDFGCSRCIDSIKCKKGCPAHAFDLTGTINAPDGACSLRKLQMAMLAKQGGKACS